MTDHLDRKLTAREKIAKALALHLDGRPWAEIAREVGYANEQNAHRAVRRHLAQHPADGIEEMRQTDNMRLERIIKELTEYAREVHYATCSRGLVYFDGKPVIDRSPNIAAYRALDKVIASHRRLNGLDAPVTIRLEDVAEDSEIETIVATMITASSVLCYPTGYAGPELDAQGCPVPGTPHLPRFGLLGQPGLAAEQPALPAADPLEVYEAELVDDPDGPP